MPPRPPPPVAPRAWPDLPLSLFWGISPPYRTNLFGLGACAGALTAAFAATLGSLASALAAALACAAARAATGPVGAFLATAGLVALLAPAARSFATAFVGPRSILRHANHLLFR